MEKKLNVIPEAEKVGKKKPPIIRVKNTTVQKVELIVDNVLVIFAPGEIKELPKGLQLPSRIGLTIVQ